MKLIDEGLKALANMKEPTALDFSVAALCLTFGLFALTATLNWGTTNDLLEVIAQSCVSTAQ